MKEEKKNSKLFFIMWLIIVFSGSLYTVSKISKETLWYDEAYSAMIIKHPLPDIIKITASDSHPPLYYLSLSLYSKIFGNSVFSLRFFSFLWVIGLALLGLTSLRKIAGKEISLIFTLFLFLFPLFFNMGRELRMYTLGAFLVTFSTIEMYNFIHTNTKASFIKFILFSILAMWTHYFSLLSVAIIDLISFLWIIFRRKKWLILPFMSAILIQVLTYIPWVFALLSQAGRVAKDFWIPKIDFWTFLWLLIFPFSDKFGVYWVERPWTDLIALIFSIVLLMFGIRAAFKSKRDVDRFALFCFLVYFFVLISGIVISEFFRPIIVPRYLTSVYSLLMIFIAYSISKLPFKTLKYLSIIFLAVCLVNVHFFINNNRFNGAMDKVKKYLENKITSNDIFLHVDEHTFGTFAYYFPENKHYLYLGPAYKGYSGFEAFKPNGIVKSNDIDRVVQSQKEFWLVNYNWAPQRLLSESWIVEGKLILKDIPRVFQYRASFYRPKIFRVSPSTNRFSEVEWGKLHTTNLLDTHIFSDKSFDLIVSISGIKKIQGELNVILYENNILPENMFMFKVIKVTSPVEEVKFEGVPAGTYSVFVYQDLNLNEKPDKIFEPEGFSGRCEDESEFVIDNYTNIVVKLK